MLSVGDWVTDSSICMTSQSNESINQSNNVIVDVDPGSKIAIANYDFLL
jgi:hypothetical protein